jgi:hypothetical protein
MLVLFQNTIIYNPFLPPNARRCEISDYISHCRGVSWREEAISSLDGTQLALCVSEVSTSTLERLKTQVYILYMQGRPSAEPLSSQSLSCHQETRRLCLRASRTYPRCYVISRHQTRLSVSQQSASVIEGTGNHMTDLPRVVSTRIQRRHFVG